MRAHRFLARSAMLALLLLALFIVPSAHAAQVPQLTIIDQTAESLAVFGRTSCTQRSSTQWIVWHQIVNGHGRNYWDGTKLAAYFRASKGWSAPGYAYLLDSEPLPDGTVKIWQMWPDDCISYGVGENYNVSGIHIAYVDVPGGGPPNKQQLYTFKLLTLQLMQKYGIDANDVVSHAETALAKRGGAGWSQSQLLQWQAIKGWTPPRREIPAACDNLADAGCLDILKNPHSDPVGVDMDAVRAELGGSSQLTVVAPTSQFALTAKAVGSYLPCVIPILVLALVFSWVVKDPLTNTKKLLKLLAKIQDWRHRRKLLRELRRAEERHGLVGIGFPTILAIAFVVGGLQLKTEGLQLQSCNFQIPLSKQGRGVWGFGVHTDYQEYHTGVDIINGYLNEPIPAAADGKVVWASWWPGDPKWKLQNIGHGNTVVVETFCNGVPYYHFYAHLNGYNVKVGQTVKQGETVGFMGKTGAGDGVHLHFAISTKAPAEAHVFADWVDPDQMVKDHSAIPSTDFLTSIKVVGFQFGGWGLVILAVLVVLFFGEGRGILALVRQSVLPGLFFAAVVLYGQFRPAISVIKFDWTQVAKLAYTRMTQPVEASMPKLPDLFYQAGGSTVEGTPANLNDVAYVGVYGAINGWGTLGETSNGAQAVQRALQYVKTAESWNTGRKIIPVVNVRYASDTVMEDIIDRCRNRCVVMIDITPLQDVSGIIQKFAPMGEYVWIDIDLEHKGSKTSAQEFNGWAQEYFTIRKQNGFTSLGLVAVYDFRSDPWLTPSSQVVWEYNQGQGYVVPIFDGHCSGTSCWSSKVSATRAMLGNYPGAKAQGIMEFITKWGCGSKYGDCGFTPQQYWAEFKPLIFMSQ